MLTRSGVAKRLGKSIASVRRMEGVELFPTRDVRGVHRFDPGEVGRVARDARHGMGKSRYDAHRVADLEDLHARVDQVEERFQALRQNRGRSIRGERQGPVACSRPLRHTVLVAVLPPPRVARWMRPLGRRALAKPGRI